MAGHLDKIAKIGLPKQISLERSACSGHTYRIIQPIQVSLYRLYWYGLDRTHGTGQPRGKVSLSGQPGQTDGRGQPGQANHMGL